MRSVLEIVQLGLAGALPALACVAVGLWLLRPLGLAPRGAERLGLAFVLGSGFASLAILGLRLLDVPIPLLGCAAVAALAIPRWRPPAFGASPTPRTPGRKPWVRGVDALALVAALLSWLAALGPETGWDGFEYHLPMIEAWSSGPIRALPAQIDAEFRAGVDLLYLPAVAAGRPDAAAAISACFALALAAGIRAEATRRASPGAGSLAGLLTLTLPLVTSPLDGAPTTYVDLAVGAYGFTALLFADRWNRTGERNALWVSALCLAFVANAKLHAFVLCPVVLILVMLGGRRPPMRTLVQAGACVLVLVSPWLVKTGLTTGNPFFPFFGDWLGTGPTSERLLALRRFRLSTDVAFDPGIRGFLQYVAAIQVGRNPHVGGLVGPLPLALAPLALHRMTRATAVLTITLAVLFVLQFVSMPALRFGMPTLAFAGVAAAVGGARLARSGKLAQAVVVVSIGMVAVQQAGQLGERYAARIAALPRPDAYRENVFPDQMALRQVVAGAEPVVAIPMGAVHWMTRPVYNLLWERNGELVFQELRGSRGGVRMHEPATPPDEALALLRQRGVRSLVIDAAPPHPRDGRVGHPTVDTWLREGRARLRDDNIHLRARGQRVWVVIELDESD